MTSDFGFNGTRRVPPPVNEPIKGYAPGSPERAELKARLTAMAAERIEIPLVIGGKEVRGGETAQAVMPHDHGHVLADWHKASKEHVGQAIEAAAAARREWASWPWEDRAAVFLKAAELLATTWRATLNAATMLGQSKTAFQAEIDSACELIDFWRFNPSLRAGALRRAAALELRDVEPARLPAARGLRLRGDAVQLHVDRRQPAHRPRAHGQHRALEAGLRARVLSAYYILKLLEAAGLPPGVINFVPGNAGRDLRRRARHRDLAGVHFTGSTERVQLHVEARSAPRWTATAPTRASWARPAARTSSWPTPRPTRRRSRWPSCAAASSTRGRSARPRAASTCRDRSGTTCATGSWRMIGEIAVGDVQDFRNFMGAVIDKKAFDAITAYLAEAEAQREDPRRRRGRRGEGLLRPAHPGRDRRTPATSCCARRSSARWSRRTSTTTRSGHETLQLVDETSPYALTGAVFAQRPGRGRGRRRRRCGTRPATST